MIKVNCLVCAKELLRSPSKIEPRNYCSRYCYAKTRDQEFIDRSKPFRISKESRDSIYNKDTVPKGISHYAWKGESVSYRGLHYWLRRQLGKPSRCLTCGKEDTRPKHIQWASKDGEYPREASHYIPLCASCHKIHDLAIRASQS